MEKEWKYYIAGYQDGDGDNDFKGMRTGVQFKPPEETRKEKNLEYMNYSALKICRLIRVTPGILLDMFGKVY